MDASQPLLPPTSSAPPQYSTVDAPPRPLPARPCRCSCCRTFILVFMLVTALLVVLAAVWPTPPTLADQISEAIPAALRTQSCLSGSTSTIKTYTFALPLYPETTVVMSRYRLRPYSRNEELLGGNIRITTSANLPLHTAYVIVTPSSLGHATVCSLVPKVDNGTSISSFGVFATGPNGASSPNLNITLILPASTAIQGLQTTLPNFAYDVDDLVGAGVSIRVALITGGEKAITVQSISGQDRLLLLTWNAGVSVNFARSPVLDVSTGASLSPSSPRTNASISGTYVGTWVRLITSNSPIDAHVQLLGSSGTVDAYTANASLALSILPPQQEEKSDKAMKLRLRAATADAAATVRLPPAYEGTFRLSGESVRVQEPRGDGDARKLEYYYDGPLLGVNADEGEANTDAEGRVLSGAVYLTDEGIERGWVSVTSTGGGVRLIL
ncbi:hypothetical protein GGX14DRAFT_545071 [Mycena pura]|uniref:Uncharacterized protein n=1 Tax=Mycena pura TaxID=153505 RepID=A0AAD6V4I8_9AGAR|nr:hypothetical protein GGX14DRAFT_545071 [Mycena pura]